LGNAAGEKRKSVTALGDECPVCGRGPFGQKGE